MRNWMVALLLAGAGAAPVLAQGGPPPERFDHGGARGGPGQGPSRGPEGARAQDQQDRGRPGPPQQAPQQGQPQQGQPQQAPRPQGAMVRGPGGGPGDGAGWHGQGGPGGQHGFRPGGNDGDRRFGGAPAAGRPGFAQPGGWPGGQRGIGQAGGGQPAGRPDGDPRTTGRDHGGDRDGRDHGGDRDARDHGGAWHGRDEGGGGVRVWHGGPDRRPGFAGGYDGHPGGRSGAWDRGWREDRRYDWRDWRNENRGAFHAGRYAAPRGYGWGYRRYGIGAVIASAFFAQDYWIGDPDYYRLPPVYGPYRWVRYYNDALLVDVYSGQVVDAIPDFFW